MGSVKNAEQENNFVEPKVASEIVNTDQ
ncbi:hypothetical protein LYNGBM3L_24850 [Moorena producens 3L]|uniref:Uncharacterized protein n=1 Tax=Moorena producens 3L TaxID=489825 RepID=F4XST4_9CYAN|nr:hypothetical protein LYNGBM3L_24850 [Moorena producens 3L]